MRHAAGVEEFQQAFGRDFRIKSVNNSREEI